jgi:hypothetical protein
MSPLSFASCHFVLFEAVAFVYTKSTCNAMDSAALGSQVRAIVGTGVGRNIANKRVAYAKSGIAIDSFSLISAAIRRALRGERTISNAPHTKHFLCWNTCSAVAVGICSRRPHQQPSREPTQGLILFTHNSNLTTPIAVPPQTVRKRLGANAHCNPYKLV